MPLIVADDVIGTLSVWREGIDSPSFAPEEAQLIRRFAALAALAYANAQQRDRLREQALTDELTGLANRRHFHERLTAELARAEREGRDVARGRRRRATRCASCSRAATRPCARTARR